MVRFNGRRLIFVRYIGLVKGAGLDFSKILERFSRIIGC